MTYELADNRYGKSRIRLVTVARGGGRHELRDLTVDVSLEGDFDAAHVSGDNAKLVATDTMKNTVYALAADRLVGPPEVLGLAIARHFAGYPQVDRAEVTLRANAWVRIETASGPSDDAFVRAGAGTRVATVRASHTGVEVEAGIEDLTVLKTTKSAFIGFERDPYTTLADAADRIMATKVSATWGYGAVAADTAAVAAAAVAAATDTSFDFDAAHERAVRRLLETFAEHQSASVQASLWIMASAMLDADPAIEWVRMVLPNLHHWAVDLGPFGLENRGEVFVATSEPYGLIDATVRRGS